MLRGPASISSRVTAREVVGDLERTEALRTRVERAELDLVAALATGQGLGVAEGALAQGLADVFSATTVLTGSSSSSSPGDLRTGRNWHRFRDVWAGGSRRLPGLHRAVPSVPLDEQCRTVRDRVSACVHRSRHVDDRRPRRTLPAVRRPRWPRPPTCGLGPPGSAHRGRRRGRRPPCARSAPRGPRPGRRPGRARCAAARRPR